ncbi:MAG: hypothetical protein IIA45_15455 [Bacteroidetes bacterium]|nr:hypothetical protein [Bacteroidota bacterium]
MNHILAPSKTFFILAIWTCIMSLAGCKGFFAELFTKCSYKVTTGYTVNNSEFFSDTLTPATQLLGSTRVFIFSFHTDSACSHQEISVDFAATIKVDPTPAIEVKSHMEVGPTVIVTLAMEAEDEVLLGNQKYAITSKVELSETIEGDENYFTSNIRISFPTLGSFAQDSIFFLDNVTQALISPTYRLAKY